MKPAPFEYVAPRSIEEALPLLGEDTRVLAGGQSLVAELNLRLARPARVVDVNRIAGLGVLRRSDGTLRIGATVRQATLERSALVLHHWPLLAQAVRHVGHAATRARGTVAGSAVHADPAAQLPVALLALGAQFELRSAIGTRTLAAEEFFRGIEPDELLTEIRVPPLRVGSRTAFADYAPTRGEFPLAAVAVVLSRDHATVATLGPRRATRAEAALEDGASAGEAAELVDGDGHRGALVRELTRRALQQAGRG